jgi:transposase InsO family protein
MVNRRVALFFIEPDKTHYVFRRRKRLVRALRPRPVLTAPNQEWAVDFASDVAASGRRLRIFSVVDSYTRECLALEVDTSLPSLRVTRTVAEIIDRRGAPVAIRSDNGLEVSSRHFLAWCLERKIDAIHIQPGKPTQNAHVESFHGRLRDECVNVSWFWNLFDARRKIADWRTDYCQGSYSPTFLCALKIENWFRVERYCGLFPPNPMYQLNGSFGFQNLPAKYPRSVRQRMIGVYFPPLHREPDGARTHAEKRRSLREVHPLGCLGIAAENGDAMMTAQRSDSFAGPAIPSSGEHAVPIQNTSDQIVRTDPRQHCHSINQGFRCLRVVLAAFSPRKVQFCMDSAFPVDDQDNLAARAVHINDHFFDQRSDDPFLEAHVRAVVVPNSF